MVAILVLVPQDYGTINDPKTLSCEFLLVINSILCRGGGFLSNGLIN